MDGWGIEVMRARGGAVVQPAPRRQSAANAPACPGRRIYLADARGSVSNVLLSGDREAAVAATYFGVSFTSLLVSGVRGVIEDPLLSVNT